MTIVDEIKATEIAEKLKGMSPKRGKELLNLMNQMILNDKRKYNTILESLNLNEEDILYPIFDKEVRALLEAAGSTKNRLLLLNKMLELF